MTSPWARRLREQRGDLVVHGGRRPRVAGRAEVFRHVEAEPGRQAEPAGGAPVVGRADGLRGVLDEVAVGGLELVDVGALAVEVDRHDADRAVDRVGRVGVEV